MKTDCDIILDLLPLYQDNACSEESRAIVEEQLLECSSCRSGSDGAIPLSEAALTALRHTVYADDDKLFSFSLNSEGLEQLNRASEAYLKYRFEKDFKTLNFYKAIT